MKQPLGEYMVYTITIGNIATGKLIELISSQLKNHDVLGAYQFITPTIEGEPGCINIPRLCTFWRGNDAETAWQTALKIAVAKVTPDATVEINVAPWAPAPGYPMGELAS